jgi:hypothetical protein
MALPPVRVLRFRKSELPTAAQLQRRMGREAPVRQQPEGLVMLHD